jgi:hypothetical protein
MKPTNAADLKRINAMFSTIQGLLQNLWARWQDEGKYENIDDYGKVIAKNLPKGFKLSRMTKRPFGFEFSINGGLYAIKATGQYLSWKRVS